MTKTFTFHPPRDLIFTREDGKAVLRIKPDGRLEIGDGFTPTEAGEEAAKALVLAFGDAAMTAPTPAQTQPRHDADDLVTDEMIKLAVEALWDNDNSRGGGGVAAALRAVAPLIAARAAEFTDICGRYRTAVRTAERGAIARDLMDAGWEEAADYVLERGRTPPARRPGEIDWSAMDKD
jgi:hypothetical protein